MQLCYNGLVRKPSSILLAMLGLRAFALSIPELPRTDYADTEVSTNGMESTPLIAPMLRIWKWARAKSSQRENGNEASDTCCVRSFVNGGILSYC